MKKIESLTPDQVSRMPEVRDEWIRYGLSTEPADREMAETAVRLMYEAAKRQQPSRIVWCGGPLSLVIVDAILKNGQSVRASVRDSVWASVGDSVGDSVWASVMASVRDSVWASVRDSVGDSVWASVWASVGASVRDSVVDSVWASVMASVRDSVWASVGDSVGDSVGASVWASVGDSVWASVRASVRDSVSSFYSCNWLAFYDFFDRVCELREQTLPLRGLRDLHKSAGHYLARERVCLVAERPRRLRRDGLGRLHAEDGAAIEYPDGWGVYSWHGTTVPEEWILTRATLDPKTALTWGNVEQRRAAIEIVGWDRVLATLPNRVVNRNRDPEIGTLISVDLPDSPNSRFLRVRCGTGRSFVLPVPQEMETARQANAWTYGLDEKQYRPEART